MVKKALEEMHHQSWMRALRMLRVEQLNIARMHGGLWWISIMYLPQDISGTRTDNSIIAH